VPIPIPPPDEVERATAAATKQPYYLRDRQSWAVQQERQRHEQALYMVGEWAVFYLMWHQADQAAGLVGRCSRCYPATDGVTQRVSAVYNQPTQNRCPVCFGTTFDGGFRARIIRPAILSDADESDRPGKRGSMHPANLTVESTPDFRAREGDFVLRADGSRWRLGGMSRVQLRTGFEHPNQADNSITYNNTSGKLEDRTSVAYLLPPADPAQLRMVLSQPLRFPGDFTFFERINGPLIPDAGLPVPEVIE
jgi:hypothetical protein